MTEIRPSTPEEGIGIRKPSDSSSIQMQGFAGSFSSSLGGPMSVHDKDGLSSVHSVHSEPDFETIMPLPGAAPPTAHAQMQNARSPVGGGSRESESDHPPLERQSSDFTTIEHPLIGHELYGDDLTARALETCKKTVLQPYLVFLKAIGWRRLRSARYDLEPPLWQTIVNFVWPTFVCLLIVASCATQIVTCFRRDAVVPNLRQNSSSYNIECERHILTSFIIPDILLLVAFMYGLYIFRWAQTEHLFTLTEAVFLGHITRHGRYSHKRLTFTLQLLMGLGLLWIVYSLGASVFRTFSYHLLDQDTKLEWIPSYKEGVESSNLAVRCVLVIVSLVGFIVLDIAYTAVVMNYSIQCQLLIYLLHSICNRMRAKEWEIDQTIKEIKNAREFLTELNSHLARAVSILFFIFLTSSIQAFYGLHQVTRDDPLVMAAVGGILSAVQWTTILALPLIQAARVTRACTKLKKTGLEIRARPYSYADTHQLDLDSLVVYTSGLNMSAKLISIPMYPAVVAGSFFAVGLILFLVFQYDSYSWVKWL